MAQLVLVDNEVWYLVAVTLLIGACSFGYVLHQNTGLKHMGWFGAGVAIVAGAALLVPFAGLVDTNPTPEEALREACTQVVDVVEGHKITETVDDPRCR